MITQDEQNNNTVTHDKTHEDLAAAIDVYWRDFITKAQAIAEPYGVKLDMALKCEFKSLE